MAFNLEPPKNITDLFRLWDVQTDQHLCSLICMGASAILWSIWLFKNEGIFFYKKQLYHYLQVVFRATYWIYFLNALHKEERQTFSEVGMSHDGDRGYGNFCQAWMAVAEKA